MIVHSLLDDDDDDDATSMGMMPCACLHRLTIHILSKSRSSGSSLFNKIVVQGTSRFSDYWIAHYSDVLCPCGISNWSI